MLDKSVPYFPVVMRRCAGRSIPRFTLPKNYSFVYFGACDDHAWADIETSAGEFDNTRSASHYFVNHFLPYEDELKRRMLFIQDENGEKIATGSAWWHYSSENHYPQLHWIAVKPAHQQKGLGKAIAFEALRRLIEIEGDIEIILETQTWSYRAIGIYLSAGFEIVTDGSYPDCKNEYEKALPILREKMGNYFNGVSQQGNE